MKRIEYFITQTATYQFFRIIRNQIVDFFETFGKMSIRFLEVLKYILTGQFSYKHIMEQSSHFAIDSLPITLTIVSMTSIILAVQVAPEMVKQGGANFIGGLLAIVTVREMGTIMTGFAIISMIGSSMASEIATMKVTEQVSALKVLHVNPIKYLFVPRILAAALMMPVITTVSSTIGIFCGGFISSLTSPEVTGLCFVNSVKLGLFNRDIGIMLLKSSCFGIAIAHISSSCGYDAEGGAKSVGVATTKSVVWSFIAIVVIDYVFALLFYF
ncbi:ABC transporter permease [bacterium]|nr:ABC transporter permease [bacterium]